MEITDLLHELGLNQKETAVYLALLKAGETHVVPLVHTTKFPRATVVYLLEALAEKRLVQIIRQNNRRVYIAEPPRTLLSILRAQKTSLEKSILDVKQSLPELNKLYAASSIRPDIRYYRGRQQIRELYNEMLSEPIDLIQYVGEYHSIIDILGEDFLKKWVQKRIGLKISTQSIRTYKDRDVTNPTFLSSPTTKRAIRYAPNDFSCPGHISIYGDIVSIITTTKENFAVVIVSRDYSVMMQNWFKQLWKVSDK